MDGMFNLEKYNLNMFEASSLSLNNPEVLKENMVAGQLTNQQRDKLHLGAEMCMFGESDGIDPTGCNTKGQAMPLQ